MPELPEVETVVRELRPSLIGRRLVSVRLSEKALRRPWSPEWNPVLCGRDVEEIERRGKWIILRLQGERFLVLHLGMTGQLVVHPANTPVAEHTHLILELDNGKELRFRDIRRFGSATLLPHPDALKQFFDKVGLGPEPFDLDRHFWKERLAGTTRCLKAVLLDQRLIAGVGNIYADEALFEARLHPARVANTLSAAEVQRLGRWVVVVLRKAIDQRGSSIRNYVGGSGQKGKFQEQLRVYGRTGQPCRRCRTPIERIRLAGRSTHFCPSCQRAGVSRTGTLACPVLSQDEKRIQTEASNRTGKSACPTDP